MERKIITLAVKVDVMVVVDSSGKRLLCNGFVEFTQTDIGDIRRKGHLTIIKNGIN